MKKDEPALLAKVNETLRAMDAAGEIDAAWNKWLGPDTEFKMTRTEKVTPLSELKFEPIP
jgi:polar amino acid transport system substrate-binding protein